jgi:hypothetical protein
MPGSSGPALAAQAASQQGIPELVIPSGPLAGVEQLLMALSEGGGIAPEQLMQLLSLLSGGGAQGAAGPQQGPVGSAGASPIEAAMAGLG